MEQDTLSQGTHGQDAHGAYEQMLAELHAWPRSEGVKLGDLIHLPDPLRSALQGLIREGSVTLERFSEDLGLDLDHTNTVVDALLDHGFLRTSEASDDGQTHYRLWYARAHRREKPLDVWTQVLDHLDRDEGETPDATP